MSQPDQYDYSLPRELIAQKPAAPRDAARLLVYSRKTRKIIDASFRTLADYIPENAVLVFNETKVLPARLYGKRSTGGRVELLVTVFSKGIVRALINKKLRPGEIIQIGNDSQLTFKSFLGSEALFSYRGSVERLLNRYGVTPVPPYIRPTVTESILRGQYQTIFAKYSGSVAAPTASLHFTKRLLRALEKKGIELHFVTLHVGLGTFAPVTESHLKKGLLHPERYAISSKTARALERAKNKGRPIIAVGTTVARTLESSADARGRLKKLSGETRLFIRCGYRFRFIDGLITNFHVPRSSLLMLIAAFSGEKEWRRIYEFAKKNNYRFFSFGDGMLIR